MAPLMKSSQGPRPISAGFAVAVRQAGGLQTGKAGPLRSCPAAWKGNTLLAGQGLRSRSRRAWLSPSPITTKPRRDNQQNASAPRASAKHRCYAPSGPDTMPPLASYHLSWAVSLSYSLSKRTKCRASSSANCRRTSCTSSSIMIPAKQV
jgi:hypothetical protein